METMKAIVKEKPEAGVTIKEVPVITELAPNEVLVEVKASAICGTDLHIYDWNEWSQHNITPPRVIGHEFSGIVVETGKDVLIVLDSITRLARAYNLSIPTSGRTLSGGFDPMALFPPKKFFGAARNFEIPGSLTIVGTSLVNTGSRMDDLIYEEFKGTGNQEIHLSRHLAERRIYPAIDVQKSGTRRDDLLIDGVTYQSIVTLHRMLDMLNDDEERTLTLISQLKKTKDNKEFLVNIKQGG